MRSKYTAQEVTSEEQNSKHFFFSSRETCNPLRFSLFWDVTQRRLVITDVSGQSLCPVFKGQAIHEEFLDCFKDFHSSGMLHSIDW